MSTITQSVDFRGLTERQQATWATGDFNEIGRGIAGVSEDIVRAVDPSPSERVLDVACGSGNTALVAARRFGTVAGIDFVPALVDRARRRAEADGLDIDFQVADAQALPFPDASFDVVVSVFGVIFAPDQEQAASELLRVCRPGGRIALACWMPEDFGRDFFGLHARHVPPPPGAPSPLRWGTDEGLAALLGAGTWSIESAQRTNLTHMRSIEHAVETFARWFGPTARTLQALDEAGRKALLDDLAALIGRYNVARDGTVAMKQRYLQAIAVRE